MGGLPADIPVADLVDAASEIMLKITGWVMEVAPFGVFAAHET